VASWFAGSWLSARRDRSNKRRDLRVHYLIEAYRRLSTVTQQQLNAEYFADIDSAILDIQLFGTADQISAAQTFAEQLAEHREAQVDRLLASLRDELRDELMLGRVAGPIVCLRPNFELDRKR
jgi:hypothetical protein